MPEITMEAFAGLMKTAVADAMGDWLSEFELIEGVPDAEPWYGSRGLYANPFAISFRTRGMTKPCIATRGDFAVGVARMMSGNETRRYIMAAIHGKATREDASNILRGILSCAKY